MSPRNTGIRATPAHGPWIDQKRRGGAFDGMGRLSMGQRVCAGVVVAEVGVLGWCVHALVRTYRAVKGKHG